MREVQRGPVIGFVSMLALLGTFATTVGLGGPAWVVGIGCAAGANGLLVHGLSRSHVRGLGPADRVTLARAVLVVGVAGLTAQSYVGSASITTLVVISAVALVLDAVDGVVARRTDTASAFGARFDMEVDAFLIFVLSVYVAHTTGSWVLAIGLARYAFVAVRLVFPWLRGSVPPRQWCKVVAAVQGIALTVVAADVLSSGAERVGLACALLLLSESFGREALQLWHARSDLGSDRDLMNAGTVRNG